jgi:hypothetical protein
MAARSGSTKRGAVVEDKGGAHWWIGLAKNERSSFEIVDHGRYALVKTKKKKNERKNEDIQSKQPQEHWGTES